MPECNCHNQNVRILSPVFTSHGENCERTETSLRILQLPSSPLQVESNMTDAELHSVLYSGCLQQLEWFCCNSVFLCSSTLQDKKTCILRVIVFLFCLQSYHIIAVLYRNVELISKLPYPSAVVSKL